jgi:hypothetical protein
METPGVIPEYRYSYWAATYPFFEGNLTFVQDSVQSEGVALVHAFDADGAELYFQYVRVPSGDRVRLPLDEILQGGRIEGGMRHGLLLVTTQATVGTHLSLSTPEGEFFSMGQLSTISARGPFFLPLIGSREQIPFLALSNLEPIAGNARVKLVTQEGEQEEIVPLPARGSRVLSIYDTFRLEEGDRGYLRLTVKVNDAQIGVQLLTQRLNVSPQVEFSTVL